MYEDIFIQTSHPSSPTPNVPHVFKHHLLQFRQASLDILQVNLDAKDEIDCLVKGMAFFMAHYEGEAYTWEGDKSNHRLARSGMSYPYMLANVGSGTGFIVVYSEHKWERVSGTSIGGSTFYGLCHLLTGEASFDKMLDGAEDGCNENVDLTVGDIYGGDYSKFGLKAATIAASFGKAVTWSHSGISSSSSSSSSSSLSSNSRRGSGGDELTEDIQVREEQGPCGKEDGSFKSVGKRGRGGALGGTLDPPTSTSSTTPSLGQSPAHTFVPRSWDPASIIASAHGGEGGGGEGSAAPPFLDVSCISSASPSSRESFSPLGSSLNVPQEDGGGSSAQVSAGWEARDAYRALLIMISNNVGQLAHLNALRYKCKHIYFAGNFLRVKNTIAMRTLAYAIKFWSKGTMEGLFLRHEGYCGALGAFLSTLEQE